jgi:hypothetical protein
MDQNEFPLDPHHLGVPWGVHKTISKPISCSVQTVQNEPPIDPHHWGGPSGVPKKISTPVVHSAQTVLISWPRLTPSPSGPKRTSIWPTSSCSSNGCAQNNSWAYCTFGSSLQRNQNELPFDPRHLGVPRFCPKGFSSLLHVRCKPCTYLACWLTLSPNGPKWAFI